jgi:iron(III) transport system substrate-binding protein
MYLRHLLLSVLFAALSLGPVLASAEGVNLYSARKEQLIKPLLDQFSQSTGIKVNLVTGNAPELLKRLETEGANSPADLLITTDAGNLYHARQAGVLQAVKSATLEKNIPAHLRDSAGYWFGLSLRARPIFYVKDRVKPEELSSYEDLANEKWKGRICIRSSDNIYNQSLVASMIAHLGEAETENWAQKFVANFARPPKGGDRDQIKAAAEGVCDLAISNTYYVGNMIAGKDEAEKSAADKVAVFWPNQADRGTHVNVSGVGLTASSKNRDAAILLMEFLASKEAQHWYAEVNNEYPVVEKISPSRILNKWGNFKHDELPLEKLGELNAAAVKLMDRAGWK